MNEVKDTMQNLCADCEQTKFLKCAELPEGIRLCKIDIRHELITMLESIPEEYRKESKIVIMRLNKESNEWYAWLCKTDIAIDTGAD